jgi:hypothetical protein
MTIEAFREVIEGYRREIQALPVPTPGNVYEVRAELARLASELRLLIEDFACMKDEEKPV